MKTLKKSAVASAACLLALQLFSGCINNDIPYPHIQPNFVYFEVDHQRQAASIDTVGRAVTVFLTEDADIRRVVLVGYDLSPAEAQWPDSAAFLNGIDLSQPVRTDVQLYQNYEWTVTAVQNIERYFTVERQVGASSVDPEARRVVAYIPASANLNAVTVTSIKLGSPNATMSPDLEGRTVDFSQPVTVDVTDYGRTEQWTIYVERAAAEVTTVGVDAWSEVAWAYGSAEAGFENGFQYREATALDWTDVPQADVTHDGGAFTARISPLKPMTTYVCRAVSGTAYGEEVTFTTQDTAQMPNHGFENWWLENNKIWNPWAEDGQPWWDTGNDGAATLGRSNTMPTNDTPTGTGRAAQLETKFVGFGPLGKLAAGNFFAGIYVRTDGTNGVLSFGRDWELRPTRLTGWMKYHSAIIDKSSAEMKDLIGRPDTCIVWVALIDSPEPFEIRTKPSERHLFNPDGPEVVAYGQRTWGYDVADWTQFEVKLHYKSTSRKPRYLLVVSSASKYGDYFTGGNGSMMLIDDYMLHYD